MDLIAADQSIRAALALVLELHYYTMQTNFCHYYNISLQRQCNSHQFGIPKQPLQLGDHYLIREKHEFTKQAN